MAETGLASIDTSTAALAKLTDVRDILKYTSALTAVEHVREAAGAALDEINKYVVKRLWLIRRGGELLAEMEFDKGGRPTSNRSHDATSLSDLGINKSQSSRWQFAARIDDDEYAVIIAEHEARAANDKLSVMAVIDACRKLVRQREAAEDIAERAAEARKFTGGKKHGVVTGDFRDIAKNIEAESVDMIFTDPPYFEEYIPLFGDMAVAAKRILKPGGSLITYFGQYSMPQVMDLLGAHLKFYWPLCVMLLEPPWNQRQSHGVQVKWKPLLWYVKKKRSNKSYLDDAVPQQYEKGTHEWQQGLSVAEYYVEHLTKPNDMVYDPFCGGGTTSVAAKKLGRKWTTHEIEPDRADIARERIAKTT